MDLSTLNLWAVLVAALASFAIGSIWYSPMLFANKWQKTVGLTMDDLQNANMGKLMGLSFFYSLIMAFCLGMFLNDPSIGTSMGAFYGFLTGFGWIFFVIATSAMYEQRPFSYVLISGGHWVVTFTIMGAILGAWK